MWFSRPARGWLWASWGDPRRAVPSVRNGSAYTSTGVVRYSRCQGRRRCLGGEEGLGGMRSGEKPAATPPAARKKMKCVSKVKKACFLFYIPSHAFPTEDLGAFLPSAPLLSRHTPATATSLVLAFHPPTLRSRQRILLSRRVLPPDRAPPSSSRALAAGRRRLCTRRRPRTTSACKAR